MKKRLAFLAVFLLGPSTGCVVQLVPTLKKSHVVFLPGIGGNDPLIERCIRIIKREAPDTSAQVWDWTRIEYHASWLNLANLQDYKRNRRRSDELARQLIAWRLLHPKTKLYLIGFSGGTAIATWACEKLPADFAIERVIFLSAGLSPGADISPVLKRSRQGVVNFYSSGDALVLHDYTIKYGTMDRMNSQSAGYHGFDALKDSALADKLTQRAWSDADRPMGHDGGHVGSLAPSFFSRQVVPLLREPAEP